MLRKLLLFLIGIVAVSSLASCMVDDSYSSETNVGLAFSEDTVSLDTIFTSTPSTTKSMWVYNRSKENLRFDIDLVGGNQQGFRVNANGRFLSPLIGSRLHDVELKRNDSLRIYVEVTPENVSSALETSLTDLLTFGFSNGFKQSVVLRAHVLKAIVIQSLSLDRDTVLAGDVPYLVKESIVVHKDKTLTLDAGTKFYFESGACLKVDGRLICKGTPDRLVVFRGSRFDKIAEGIPYDRISGQWQGIRFGGLSYENVLEYVDIHSAHDALYCDSAQDNNRRRLSLRQCQVYNNDGYGLFASNSNIDMENCIFANSAKSCMEFHGGTISLNGVTATQFYPFSGGQGKALLLSNGSSLDFQASNSIITGYGNSEIDFNKTNKPYSFNYNFRNSLIRLAKPSEPEDLQHFQEVVFEDADDSIGVGIKQFDGINTELFFYRFNLNKLSKAIGVADPLSTPQVDVYGRKRRARPAAGAVEFFDN